MRRQDLVPVTRSRLRADVRQLGLRTGDTVMLHASVSAIGWVVGGPDRVIQALLDVLTSDGTLMMNTSWDESPYGMEEWSEERQRAYCEECPPFDPATSRAHTEMLGVVAEDLRTWPGARRSDHPDSSFAAVGAKAEWITGDQPLNYPLGEDSPLAKLVELDGRVLLLGAPLETITLIHHAENLARVPDKPVVRYRAPVLRDGQAVWVEIEELDTNKPMGRWDGDDYFGLIAREALGHGTGWAGKVGGAESHIFEARPLVDFAVQWLERTFG